MLRGHGIAAAPLLAMAPGTIWETKHWGSGKFAEVARHFMQQRICGGADRSRRERAVCEEVARLAPGAVDFAGETNLTELAALIRRSTISVTNNSGPMHLGGGARPAGGERFRPDRSDLDRALSGAPGRGLAGGRPLLALLAAPAQPLPHGHVCMEDVSARAVIERMEHVLDAGGTAPLAAQNTSFTDA